MVNLQPRFPEIQKRFAAWWKNSSLGDRPIVCAREVRRPDAPPPPEDSRPRGLRELDPKWQLANARWTLAAHARPADTLPCVAPEFANSLGIPAALAGGRIDYRPDGHCWIEEMADIYQRELRPFSADHPVFRSLDESAALLCRELGDQAIVNPPFLMDGLTTLSLFRGAEQTCIDLLECPADVKRVANHLDQLAVDFHAAIYKTLVRHGQGHTVTWADVYAPGSCEMLQNDFSVNISLDMFDEFVMPLLHRWANHFDYNCYHLDGIEQWRFIDRYCQIDRITSIQWQPGDTQRKTLNYLPHFREMRRRGRAVWVMGFDTEMPVNLTREFGPDGLMFYLREIDSAEDIERMLPRLEQAAAEWRQRAGGARPKAEG